MAVRRLTETEARVARLVAAGFHDDEVAQALDLSRKTIEWHVTRVCWKVGAHSRSELPAALAIRAETQKEER
jgi:DNA-binding CsgD family transcriptional regulator